MKKIFYGILCLTILCSLNATAQMVSESDDFETGAGSKFSWAFTDPNAKSSMTAPGGVFLAQARYEASAIIQRWFNLDCSFGFDIKNNPFCTFDAKAIKNFSMPVAFQICWSDGSQGNISTTLDLTTAMQTYKIDLVTLIHNAEVANNKTVKMLRNIQFQFPWITPGVQDTFAFYMDNWKLGDAANPCLNIKPTLTAPASVILNFNQKNPAIANLSNITDGNGGTKVPITLTAVSLDSTIIANPAIVYTSPESTGSLQILGAKPPKNGTTTIVVTVSDTAYCNNKIIKSFTATVKPEVLNFSILAVNSTVSTTANAPEQTVQITNITNIAKSGSVFPVPDNYEGITLTAKINTGAAYIGTFTDVISIDSASGTANFKYTPIAEGTAKLEFTMQSALTGAKKTLYLTINIGKEIIVPDGITESISSSLEVYPNPASDLVSVVLPEGADKIEIINMSGTIVKSISVKGQSGTINITVSDLAKGSYIVSTGKVKAEVILK